MLNVTSRVWGKDSWYQRHRFLFLMISLLAAIALSPLFDESRALYLFSDLFLTLVFLSGLWVVSQQRAWLLAGIALACPMLLSLWMSHVVDSSTMRVFGSSAGILFLLLLVVKILRFVFASRRVTTEVVNAAVVCFLLLGLCWAFIYALIEVLNPGSFSVASITTAGSSSAYTYFSFVTLTTLGYGDISPVAQVARSFAILEAITGQMYLAVLVARLVGTQIAHDMASEK